jgi:NOL1/NOP2/sun family putative RNA methylase
MKLPFKPAFIKKYTQLTDFDLYKKAVHEFSQQSIRINTLKTTTTTLKKKLQEKGWTLNSIPWCPDGYYIKHKTSRRDIGNTEEHKQGLFFVQKSTSMIPPIVLEPEEHETILDMSAAPGGKTTHIAALMNNTGIIIANEPDRYRLNGLLHNVQRCSVANTIIINYSGEKIQPSFVFDKILLDAPCSGSGLIKGLTQRTQTTLKEWNPNTIKRLAKLQRKLILHAFTLLKKGGTLVYSTCSLEPEEDEEIIDTLKERESLRIEKIGLPIRSSHKQHIKIWPQYYNTEGFFISKIKKL